MVFGSLGAFAEPIRVMCPVDVEINNNIMLGTAFGDGELNTDNSNDSFEINFEFLIGKKKIQAKNPYHMPDWFSIAESDGSANYYSTKNESVFLSSYIGIAGEDEIDLIYTPADFTVSKGDLFKNCPSSLLPSQKPNGCFYEIEEHTWSVNVNRKTGRITLNRTYKANGTSFDASSEPLVVVIDKTSYRGKGECKVIENENKF